MAAANSNLYSQAFPWTPSADPGEGTSIWPVWPHGKKTSGNSHFDVNKELHPYADKMPFREKFWQRAFLGKAPQGLKGYICALPVAWTKEENNHPNMNMILLTDRGVSPTDLGNLTASQQHGFV
ncbi:hypothetical protein [Pseudorhodoferax sp.]|uniref:hypothetical protein n=1 Tax=Pseudorhodoferax sp. TaxID=1993553 RepID=UPI0039E27248